MWAIEAACEGQMWLHRPGTDSRLIPCGSPADTGPLLAGEDAIAYVLAHGGLRFTRALTRLDEASLEALRETIDYLPLLNRPLYDLAAQGLARFPRREQYILCETAFFVRMPAEAAAYGLPYEMFADGVRRYGTQGLLHERVWRSFWADGPARRVISIGLGDAPSLCAMRDGGALETSAGFTLAEGIPSLYMCGTLDPAIPILLQQSGYSPAEIERLLLCRSGWQTFAAGDRRAGLAHMLAKEDHGLIRQMLRAHLLKEIGRCLAALDGTEALSFTCEDVSAWMPFIRELCDGLRFCGVEAGEVRDLGEGVWRFEREASPVILQTQEMRRADLLAAWLRER